MFCFAPFSASKKISLEGIILPYVYRNFSRSRSCSRNSSSGPSPSISGIADACHCVFILFYTLSEACYTIGPISFILKLLELQIKIKKVPKDWRHENMKGILLAGGSGTRLYPVTLTVNKHFLPIYNKPMVYYSISLLMLAKIRDVVIVLNPQDEEAFKKLLGDGSELGMDISYVKQEKPLGLSHAVKTACETLEKNCSVMVVLGDNILYGHGLPQLLEEAKSQVTEIGGAYVFAYHVPDPERFGIVEFDEEGKVISIEEKPKHPKSNYAVIGVYMFDSTVSEKVLRVKPSARGEYEITSLLEEYLKEGSLKVKLLGRGYAWFDAGTHDSFLEAGEFVATVEKRAGLMIGCVEEIAYRNGWIDRERLLHFAKRYSKTDYGKYLKSLAGESVHAL
jgi:glucose-1-phosphate thymidylyltransferase